jgi:hypothetical protein
MALFGGNTLREFREDDDWKFPSDEEILKNAIRQGIANEKRINKKRKREKKF